MRRARRAQLSPRLGEHQKNRSKSSLKQETYCDSPTSSFPKRIPQNRNLSSCQLLPQFWSSSRTPRILSLSLSFSFQESNIAKALFLWRTVCSLTVSGMFLERAVECSARSSLCTRRMSCRAPSRGDFHSWFKKDETPCRVKI